MKKQGGILLKHYKIKLKDGKYSLYSPKIGMYVLEHATLEEVKITLVTQLEYEVKLEMVKLLMTFPHGFTTIDNEIIVHQKAVDDFNEWHDKIYQRIGFLDEYYSLIDEKLLNC